MWFKIRTGNMLESPKDTSLEDYLVNYNYAPISTYFTIFQSMDYEINDCSTRQKLGTHCEKHLSQQKYKGLIRDGTAICDQSNNYPELINSGNLCLQILLMQHALAGLVELSIFRFNPETKG